MKSIYQIRLTGSGGQGLVTAGIILAEAAIIDNNDAVQTQSYGAEARGGASKSEVIVSKEKINYPKVIVPDALLAMTGNAYKKYGFDTGDGCISIVDSYYVDDLLETKGKSYLLPITDIAIEETGKIIVANIVAVGILAALIEHISDGAMEKAVTSRMPKGTEDMNIKALHSGIKMGRKVLKHCRSGGKECRLTYNQL